MEKKFRKSILGIFILLLDNGLFREWGTNEIGPAYQTREASNSFQRTFKGGDALTRKRKKGKKEKTSSSAFTLPLQDPGGFCQVLWWGTNTTAGRQLRKHQLADRPFFSLSHLQSAQGSLNLYFLEIENNAVGL